MPPPRSRTGRSISLRDSPTSRFTELEKIDGGGASWDVLEWTNVEPVSRSVPLGVLEFLHEAEKVIVGGCGVVLVNTDEAGTVFVTNFRLLFLSEGSRNIVAFGTIPLATIEKVNKISPAIDGPPGEKVTKHPSAPRNSDKTPSRRLLQVIGKDMRIIVFGFRPRTKQRRVVFDALLKCTRPSRLYDLYAFASGPLRFNSANPKVQLLNEYYRLLGMGSYQASIDCIEEGSFAWSNECWRISDLNSNYTLCSTYPFALLLPKSISDEEVMQASTFRARGRLPVVSWCHSGTGAVLARSSQPLVGIMMNMRSNADEKLVAALCTPLAGAREPRRKLYIADARPRKNALANGAMGGGSESSSNYFQSEIVFFGIDNIHAMRDSLARLRAYLDTHGATSSDGMSSFLRHGGWTWGGGNLSSMSASVSTLGDCGWLIHIHNVLAGSAWIAARIALESASVLVHCRNHLSQEVKLLEGPVVIIMLSTLPHVRPHIRTWRHKQNYTKQTDSGLTDGGWRFQGLNYGPPGKPSSETMCEMAGGYPPNLVCFVVNYISDGWDRTSQLVSLASLLLDPYYRTFKGFQALVEKDWLAFGHPFSDRAGLPTISTSSDTPHLSRQSSTGSLPSLPRRQSSTSRAPSHAQSLNNYSPIFLQWVDCVSQLLRMYPFAFEFSSAFLVDFLDSVLSYQFGNFLCNSEKERQESGVVDTCGCLWMYLAEIRASEGNSHVHYNPFYDPSKHEGPLLPPAAALAPTLWPQFHLRWACPSEAQVGEVEAQYRNMAKKFSEIQKGKEVAETNVRDTTAVMESLAEELQNEKIISSSATILAKKASKENAAVRRALLSLGCKVHFSGIDNCTVGIERNQTKITNNKETVLPNDEKSDMSISISVVQDDVSSNPISRICESLCPFRTQDGGCRWPNAGCAQLQSQYVGLKANFDAFDRLSIYDSYFKSD
ncbi:hypothetical protein LguiB_015411 [Lonicera macranthoides]